MFRKSVLSLCLLSLAVVSEIPAEAQQGVYVFGTTIDAAGGGNNRANGFRATPSQTTPPLSGFYSINPSVDMVTKGTQSSLSLSYGFGWNRSYNVQNSTTTSHQQTLTYSRVLYSRWKTKLTESFESTSDAATFDAVRSIEPTVQAFTFVANPTLYDRSARTGVVNGDAVYSFSSRASLSITAADNLRSYGSSEGSSAGLSSQQRVTAGMTYSRQVSEHDSWNVGYQGSYVTFSNFPSIRSDGANVGYGYQIVPNLSFDLSVGLSDVKNLNTLDHYLGTNTSVNLRKNFRTNDITLQYVQTSGEPTGIGSVANTRRVAASIHHGSQKFKESLSVSAFNADGVLGNPFAKTQGTEAVANASLVLNHRFSLQWGAQYQRNNQSAILGLTQKRIFASLKYTNPSFWKFGH